MSITVSFRTILQRIALTLTFSLILISLYWNFTTIESPSVKNESDQMAHLLQEIKTSKILIIAFPRSGSSMLLNILSANKEAVSVFEPFHPKILKKWIGEEVQTDLQNEKSDMAESHLERVFNCELVRFRNELKQIEN